MCLQIDEFHLDGTQNAPLPLRAKYPILVWKVLRSNILLPWRYKTPFQRTPVKLGKYLHADTGPFAHRRWIYGGDTDFLWVVDEGIHGFASIIEANDMVECGSFRIGLFERLTVHPAIIPTGARFFYGKNEEVVASSMIIYDNATQIEAGTNSVYAALEEKICPERNEGNGS